MVTSTCYANVRGDRIQFLIRKGESGYRAFAKVLTAIEKGGFMSWYGDVCDKDGNEQCGLIVTTRPQNKGSRQARRTTTQGRNLP
jgi:hypothetical protein